MRFFVDPIRSGQKRPATSPAPLIPTPSLSHHSHVSQVSNHASSHLVVGSTTPTGNSSCSSTRGPFASALRNLAKQADGKDEEPTETRNPATAPNNASGGGGGSSGVSANASASNNVHLQHHSQRQSGTADARPVEGKKRASPIADVRPTSDERVRKKTTISPAPPEKVCFCSIFDANL